MHKILWDSEIQMDNLIQARRPNLVLINKKRTCYLVDVTVLAKHRLNVKKGEKTGQIPGPGQRTENLWNMKVTVRPTIAGIFRSVPKNQEKTIRGKTETIQTTVLLKSPTILRRVLDIWGNWLSLRLQWKKKII